MQLAAGINATRMPPRSGAEEATPSGHASGKKVGLFAAACSLALCALFYLDARGSSLDRVIALTGAVILGVEAFLSLCPWRPRFTRPQRRRMGIPATRQAAAVVEDAAPPSAAPVLVESPSAPTEPAAGTWTPPTRRSEPRPAPEYYANVVALRSQLSFAAPRNRARRVAFAAGALIVWLFIGSSYLDPSGSLSAQADGLPLVQSVTGTARALLSQLPIPRSSAVTSSPTAADPSAFKPFWVKNHRITEMWSGSGEDKAAVSFGATSHQFCSFLVVRPENHGRLYVLNLATRNYHWIDSDAVGPAPSEPPTEKGPAPAGRNCGEVRYDS
ncbi:MAG: hypothetical protein U0821_14840 [Chloroflexota bacterium]